MSSILTMTFWRDCHRDIHEFTRSVVMSYQSLINTMAITNWRHHVKSLVTYSEQLLQSQILVNNFTTHYCKRYLFAVLTCKIINTVSTYSLYFILIIIDCLVFQGAFVSVNRFVHLFVLMDSDPTKPFICSLSVGAGVPPKDTYPLLRLFFLHHCYHHKHRMVLPQVQNNSVLTWLNKITSGYFLWILISDLDWWHVFRFIN